MATLEELCKTYGIEDSGIEKSAASNDVLESYNDTTGGEKMNLSDLYNEYFENADLEKIAEAEAEELESEEIEDYSAEEIEKVASDYFAAGRFMARGFYDEMQKIASEVEQMSDDEELPTQLKAEGAMGVKANDRSMLAVNTPAAREANADALKEKKLEKIMGKKKAVNPNGVVGEDHLISKDAK